MAWTVFGEIFDNASDMSDASVFQPFIFNSDIILRAVRTWVIFYNNPVLTSLNMKIYSNILVGSVKTPHKLLHTSTNSQLKTDIITLANGVKEIWFEFDLPSFNGNDNYHIVINGTGYAPTSTSYIAWMKGFPDPVMNTTYIPSMVSLGRAPYQVYFIGSQL